MANPEHLQILKQGVEAWNQWREQHKDLRLDLTEVSLRSAGLRDASGGGSLPESLRTSQSRIEFIVH
jgi:hypothetical protein